MLGQQGRFPQSGAACEQAEAEAVRLANEMQAEYWSVSAKTGEWLRGCRRGLAIGGGGPARAGEERHSRALQGDPYPCAGAGPCVQGDPYPCAGAGPCGSRRTSGRQGQPHLEQPHLEPQRRPAPYPMRAGGPA